ncbi:hypothetical protein [Pokkaliibacter plantistimulans]|uniref:hypothetical protein n=1 Tax=Pokkaliibacter plantistimulans TaxID=1635171 RepID=UPI00398F983F
MAIVRGWLSDAGVLECWSAGVLECWSAGVLECWSAGVLECWSAGVGLHREQSTWMACSIAALWCRK